MATHNYEIWRDSVQGGFPCYCPSVTAKKLKPLWERRLKTVSQFSLSGVSLSLSFCWHLHISLKPFENSVAYFISALVG